MPTQILGCVCRPPAHAATQYGGKLTHLSTQTTHTPSSAQVQQYYSTSVFSTAVLQYTSTTVQYSSIQYSATTVQQCVSPAVRKYSSTLVQRYYSSAEVLQ